MPVATAERGKGLNGRKLRDDGTRHFESFRYRSAIDDALNTSSRRNTVCLVYEKSSKALSASRLRSHYLYEEDNDSYDAIPIRIMSSSLYRDGMLIAEKPPENSNGDLVRHFA